MHVPLPCKRWCTRCVTGGGRPWRGETTFTNLLSLDAHAEGGANVALDIDLVLVLELLGEVLENNLVRQPDATAQSGTSSTARKDVNRFSDAL